MAILLETVALCLYPLVSAESYWPPGLQHASVAAISDLISRGVSGLYLGRPKRHGVASAFSSASAPGEC
eukprot:11168037-Lingulodinium_polyedra.AAC.1